MQETTCIPESGRSPGEGNGNPLQYPCLGNPADTGSWGATGHRVSRVGCDWSNVYKPPPPSEICSVLLFSKYAFIMAWAASWAFLILRFVCFVSGRSGRRWASVSCSRPRPSLRPCLASCLVSAYPCPLSQAHPPLPNSCTLIMHGLCNVHTRTGVQAKPPSRGGTQGRGSLEWAWWRSIPGIRESQVYKGWIWEWFSSLAVEGLPPWCFLKPGAFRWGPS